ncbi:choline dehydrogenase [Verminephrobacter eiseniae]|uniref:choline dehydrogenase n=1 Tax=Verminephrobacter eiseniae TaxID=364317 RepID=UPI0010D13127|nr:choline dehydrogenase [Verminephrobacter eiseniae]KAB7584297.1 choline dehydrogenase [Verminephrobacter sp. Larva24]MCW5231128.1 choline dehydrogenase [Verminephrobacter eiseniae]MCW5292860.1 choline dehydrogenase [Verminephrobacter eiseniae]MCW8186865.1 choline dehydrogenase [Verminephrobacter eiseniae]MCW8225242.1 choline dehydrogenase [Verminephrobacter eiseniae]
MTTDSFDYIIVGAGSAGCVLANRLTEDPQLRVLVLEAGPADHSLFIHMPSAFAYPLANDRYNWYYHTDPEPFMDQRSMYCPRGRVLGGSSSINGMVYIRGHALDYEGWASRPGLANWSYADCLPYFRKAEHRARGGDAYRGDSGPLKVSTGACRNPLYSAFIEAGQQAGYAYTDDMNGYRQEGLGPMDMTVHKGRRCSAAVAYLRPAMKRPNLQVRTRALVARVAFEPGSSPPRAIGVQVVNGQRIDLLRASREVILCGGAINSPQLLQLSGIGDPDALRRLGIAVLAPLRGVGANLQDHLETYVQYACKEPITLYGAMNWRAKLRIGAQWLLRGTGLGATNHFESGGFIRSAAGVRHPDLQYHFLPMAISYDGSAPASFHGFQAHVGPMRPTSRGHVRLRSADPKQPPQILFNYMATEQDRKEMRAGIRLTREIFAQPAFDRFRGQAVCPTDAVQTDAEIDAHIRAHGESALHPSCTCRMGSDEWAVTDGSARVHGVAGLRVVDASIMPDVVSGNLNAPTIMLAEKLADTICGKTPLPRSDMPYFVHPQYKSVQR